MKTFKQYLYETLSTPYPSEKVKQDISPHGAEIHQYGFTTKSGRKYRVEFKHSSMDPKNPEVEFRDEKYRVKTTGEGRGETHHILATVGHIMRQHAENHGVRSYNFSSINLPRNKGRMKVYDALVRHHGGSRHGGENDMMINYNIPMKKK